MRPREPRKVPEGKELRVRGERRSSGAGVAVMRVEMKNRGLSLYPSPLTMVSGKEVP